MKNKKHIMYIKPYFFFVSVFSCISKDNLEIPEIPDTNKINDTRQNVLFNKNVKDETQLLINSNIIIVSANINENSVKKVSNGVYGRNFAFNRPDGFGVMRGVEGFSSLNFGSVRWGGNQTSRYNWKIDADNKGFYAEDMIAANQALPYNNTHYEIINGEQILQKNSVDLLLETYKNSTIIISIPLLGWVAKDATSQTKSGIIDPENTSIKVTPEFFRPWIKRIKERYKRNKNQEIIFSLDNEVVLWTDTHADLNINNSLKLKSWEDLLNRSLNMSKMIKETWGNDAKIAVLGTWGSPCDLFDYTTECRHTSAFMAKPAIKFFAKEACKRIDSDGTLPFTHIDFHWYPQSNYLSSHNEQGDMDRLKVTRELWDYNYKANSWIANHFDAEEGTIEGAFAYFPRINKWINDSKCPEIKTLVTEYWTGVNYGGEDYDTYWSHALSATEAMIIADLFDMKSMNIWNDAPKGHKLEEAFKIFLDYDNKGSNLLNGQIYQAKDYRISQGESYLFAGQKLSNHDIPVYFYKKNNIKYALVINKTQKNANIELPFTVKKVYAYGKNISLAEQIKNKKLARSFSATLFVEK